MIRNELRLGLFRRVLESRSTRRVKNSFFFNSSDSLTVFVRSKSKVFTFEALLNTERVARGEMRVLECFCWLKMCLNIKYVALNESWSFTYVKTSVSRNTISFDDISCVNFMVARKEFLKTMKLLISVSTIVYTENMSSINLFQRNGL